MYICLYIISIFQKNQAVSEQFNYKIEIIILNNVYQLKYAGCNKKSIKKIIGTI